MLEMLTGRRPTEEVFIDGQNLQMYVEISFPNNVMQILDPHIVPKDEESAIEYGSNWNHMSRLEKCLVSLFSIGLSCSMEPPKARMDIMDVTRELNIIRNTFLTSKIIEIVVAYNKQSNI